jgi:nucleotide-binding universal stress UspA family protein
MPYRRILIPLIGTSVDADVIRIAVILAKADRAQLLGVHVIEVRWNQPLDAVLEAETERGEVVLEQATRVAAQAGGKLETELLQAREAAAAIVDTARDRGVDLILLGMPYRRRFGRTYVGRTVQTVYVTAPCAVLAYRQEEST